MDKIVILHICSIDNSKYNGVSNVVPKHFKYQTKLENVGLLNCTSIVINELNGYDNVFMFNKYKKISELPMPYNNPDIVIFHEVYKPKYLLFYLELKIRKIPYIVIPHGCLTESAQKKKKIKKRIFNSIFFDKFVNNAVSLQFLSNLEKDTSFKHENCFVLGNGMDISVNFKTSKKSQKKIKITYIGRYSIYHKGLDILLEYCSKSKKELVNNNILITLYGIGSIEDVEKLNLLVKNYQLIDLVQVHGPIFDEEKNKVLLDSDYFIQLSRFEGQPLGIMEALMYGLPLIVSDGTSFSDFVKENNCGFKCNSYIDFQKTLIQLNRINYSELSGNSRISAIQNFDWDEIAKNSVKYYRNLVKENK